MVEELTSHVMQILIQNVLYPALLIIGSTVLVILKNYAQRITDSLVKKNETECLEALTRAKCNLMEEVSEIVDVAVNANMQQAQEWKDDHGKLTATEVKKLNDEAKRLIYKTLPKSLIEEGGALSTLIGGQGALSCLIDGLIEKHVIENKKKK